MTWKNLYQQNIFHTYAAVRSLYRKRGIPFEIPLPKLKKIEKKNDILHFNKTLLNAIEFPEYHYLYKKKD